MKNRIFVLFGLFLIFFSPADCFSTSITDTVLKPLTPLGQLSGPDDFFVYGDFEISYAPAVWPEPPGDEDVAAGDGLDENWDWSFDYTNKYNSSVFNDSTQLTSAFLTLKLIAQSSQVSAGDSEQLRIKWLSSIPLEFSIVDEELTFNIELLDYYGSSEIMERFTNNGYDGSGTIPMRITDDVVVNFAELTLTTTPIPEPNTMLLLGAGTIGLVGLCRKRFFRKS